MSTQQLEEEKRRLQARIEEIDRQLEDYSKGAFFHINKEKWAWFYLGDTSISVHAKIRKSTRAKGITSIMLDFPNLMKDSTMEEWFNKNFRYNGVSCNQDDCKEKGK